MSTLRNLGLGVIFTAGMVMASDLAVQTAHLHTPNGTIDGKLVMMNNRMAFVDDNDPSQSFVIPKSDIRRANWNNGVLNIELARPYSSMAGSNDEVSFEMPDSAAAGTFVNWVGVPVRGFTGEADRLATPPMQEVSFEVKRGDQRGRLVVGPRQLDFVSLSDANHSERWQYSQIKEFKRDNDKDLKIEPFHGDSRKFEFMSKEMRETAYDVISDHIVNERLHK